MRVSLVPPRKDSRMHIPDGYLSPQTCAAAYLVAVPTIAVASRRASATLKTKQVPLLAMFAAVSFLVMMFNVPIPDGTTAHAVGAVIIAIVLGPWAAVIAVSVALLFQALLFGDGGVLAYGANVLNLAILMPFVGFAIYKLLAGRSELTSTRRVVAAFVAGYVGINAAALATAIELGIQPDLFHTAAGAPLYSPYHLSQTIPAMALAHLVVAGPVEGILTAGVFAYLAKSNPSVLSATHSLHATTGSRLTPARVALGFVAVMAVLTPLGLLAPGGAFGEDAPEDLDLTDLGLSAIPEGMERYAGFWSHTLLGDYGFSSGDNAVLAYWVSAILGILVVGGAIYVLGRVITRGPDPVAAADGAASSVSTKAPSAP
jgi:cobalt/nickel transport system permease protein